MMAWRILITVIGFYFLMGCNKNNAAIETKKSDDIEKPNIVVVLTDDQGYGDLGFTHNPHIDTPAIDQLFQQGMSFDRFYVSPVCSPTRASLLTGQHSLSTGVFHVTRGGEKMHAEQTTLAEHLKPAGYTSGIFGKWHNGLQYPHDPLGQGFDEFYGFAEGHKTLYFDSQLTHNTKTVSFKGYIADRLTDKAIEFIEHNKQKPFFTMLSFNTPHGPFEVPNQYFDKYKGKGLSDLDASIYGMMENIDDNVERVLRKLDELSIRDNTIVIYLSDNGPAFPHGTPRFNGGLKGQKGHVDEGGVRTPMVIQWPTKFKGGKRISRIAQHIDVVPTLLSLAGIHPQQNDFAGVDISPLLIGSMTEQQWPDRYLFTHRFHIAKNSTNSPVHLGPGAVRTQKWAAILSYDNEWSLYDLENDPGQQHDLNKSHADTLAKLIVVYTDWFNKVTKLHGPYTTLPIEIGHQGYDKVSLPAHESLIENDHLAYAYNDGWSHDWLVSQSKQAGQAYWPIKVVSAGRYRVTIGYGMENSRYSSPLYVTSDNQRLEVQSLKPHIPETVKSNRHYYTNEAPEMIWQQQVIGEFNLQLSDQKLTVEFANDKDNTSLWIKYLNVEKISD